MFCDVLATQQAALLESQLMMENSAPPVSEPMSDPISVASLRVRTADPPLKVATASTPHRVRLKPVTAPKRRLPRCRALESELDIDCE